MKKKKYNLINNCAYVISIAQKEAKCYILTKTFFAVVNGIYPMSYVLFPKFIIDCFSNDKDWNGILLYSGIWFFVSTLHIILSICEFNYFRVRDEVVSNKFFNIECEKTVSMDMAIIDSNDIQMLREKCTTVRNQGMCMKLLDDVFAFFRTAITVVSTFTILASVDIWVFIALIFFITVYFLLSIYNKNINHTTWTMTTEINRKAGYYSQIMSNIVYAKEIRMFTLAKWLKYKYEKVKLELVKVYKKFVGKFMWMGLASGTTNSLQNTFFYVYFGARVIFNNMAFGTFTMMIAAVNSFISTVNQLSHTIVQMFDRSNYINYYREYLDYPNVIAVERDDVLPIIKTDTHEIEFSNVTFAYPGGRQNVFNGLNLKLEANKFYVMVGVNGAGKTTLFNLLCRLYDPDGGEVLLDGVDIKRHGYREYRSLFSVVFQDYAYYAFTVAENIALDGYDGSEAVRARIEDCIEKAGLKERVSKMEKGIDTSLRKIFDNNGVDLSGGESQKLALAKALYKDTPFLLLDEPSSALDAFAEDELISRFKEASKGKTVIYVSHRLSVARYADRVIFMNGGVIEGFDTHERLLNSNETYNKLYMAQAKHYLEENAEAAAK